MKKRFLAVLLLFLATSLGSAITVSAATEPMLKKYINWDYGVSANEFTGYVPALDKTVQKHGWELFRWTGVFNFGGSKSTTMSNYDVFNVKKKPEDVKFDKENGFGLVYKSQAAVGDFFDAVWKNNMEGKTSKQLKYYRDTFVTNGSDYDKSSPYYYNVEGNSFLRTAGMVERMGARFDKTKRIGEDNYQAIYDVSSWPELKVTNGNALSIKFTASGYSERNIRVVAAKKGAFPDLSKVVSLNGGKKINTSEEKYSDTLKFNAKDLVKVLGTEVDIIVEDGYGRTSIESVTLVDNQKMDYVPTKLTLTESGQLWVKFRYNGEDIITTDYLSDRGMPMTANAKVGGAVTADFSLPSMHESLPAAIKDGQEFNYMLGKIEIGDAPGKYYIKVDTTINNPSHADRALESPADAYKNNTIHGEWLIENKSIETDLIAQSITASPSSIKKGAQTTITAKVKNDGPDNQSSVLIRFFDNNTKIYEVSKTMPANQTITVGPFPWTGEAIGVHNISVHVDPEKEKPDKDRTNNIATTGCSVNSGTAGGGDGSGDCNKAEDQGNWTVSYPLITGYHIKSRTVTWTDSKGKTHTSTETYTDYNDPIWETRSVKYQENMTIEAEVDTKQNITTDLIRPKESDRESRGSWEIIPYASKNNKKAKEITRAGYGFEVKVKTSYSNDWETKVPNGLEGTARPIGGQFYGPKSVYATIYDSKGALVKKIELEKTSGNQNNATWELPVQKVTSGSGKVYQDRKFYTSINSKDGYYKIKISSEGAGMTGLTTCITKKIEIFGSMYDDVQNLRTK